MSESIGDVPVAVLPGGYVCPSATAPVYVVSSGSTPGGLNGVPTNTNIVFMTAIGPCSSVVSGLNVVVDEATTVAAAYGRAQFYAAGGVGAAATDFGGVAVGVLMQVERSGG